jgi:transcriptional regulator with XRE-family HTH domain
MFFYIKIVYTINKGGIIMGIDLELSRRLKKAREYLSLSQRYVGSLLGLEERVISDIENGRRYVSDSELNLFSKIYGWSIDELIHGDNFKKGTVFARTDEKLSNSDKKEVMNLIKLKRKLREKKRELLEKL